MEKFKAVPIDILNSSDRAKIRLEKLKEKEGITVEEEVELEKQIDIAEGIPEFLMSVFGMQNILKNSPEFLDAVIEKDVDKMSEILKSIEKNSTTVEASYVKSIIRDLPTYQKFDEVWAYFKWNLLDAKSEFE